MRQPMLLLLPLILLIALVFIAGFGAYRAFRYGAGYRRLFGAVPAILIALSVVFFPLFFGFVKGLGAKPSLAGIGGGELLLVSVGGSLLLATVSGSILSLSFRPPKSRRAKSREARDLPDASGVSHRV